MRGQHKNRPRGGIELYDRMAKTPTKTPTERQKGYRALSRAALDVDVVDGLRAATNGGWALGDARFKQQIAKALRVRRLGGGEKEMCSSVSLAWRMLVGLPGFDLVILWAGSARVGQAAPQIANLQAPQLEINPILKVGACALVTDIDRAQSVEDQRQRFLVKHHWS
jgi:hypothetical protein